MDVGDKIRIYENRTTYPILRLERDDLLPIAGEEIARVAWLDQLYLLIKQLCSLGSSCNLCSSDSPVGHY